MFWNFPTFCNYIVNYNLLASVGFEDKPNIFFVAIIIYGVGLFPNFEFDIRTNLLPENFQGNKQVSHIF